MSKLNELIAQFCPAGVEYKTISKLIQAKTITTVTPSFKLKRIDYNELGITPIISQEEEYISGFCDLVDNNIPKRNYVCFGDHSEHIKYVSFSFVQGADGLKIMYTNESVLLARYFYHAVAHLYQKHNNYERHFKYLTDTSIPVPPLPVQSEIVRILDSFTDLTAELTAELTARKQQYEYYRDALLAFDTDVPMVKLADIATDIYRGAGIKRDEVTSDGIPCVRYGEIYTSYDISFTKCISHTSEDVVPNPKFFEHGDIIFTITGESVEEIAKSIAYLGYEKCMAGGDTVVMKHNQEPRYISYALSTSNAQAQKSKGKVKSKVAHSSVPALREITIPLPDMATQTKIADLLDHFHKLCTDITEGLPAEIEARQKQYEYYRDKLLMFTNSQ